MYNIEEHSVILICNIYYKIHVSLTYNSSIIPFDQESAHLSAKILENRTKQEHRIIKTWSSFRAHY